MGLSYAVTQIRRIHKFAGSRGGTCHSAPSLVTPLISKHRPASLLVLSCSDQLAITNNKQTGLGAAQQATVTPRNGAATAVTRWRPDAINMAGTRLCYSFSVLGKIRFKSRFSVSAIFFSDSILKYAIFELIRI